MASAHVLHSLDHVCVRPVPPASAVIPFIPHGHLNAGQHTAGQHRSHAGQSETGADSQLRFNVIILSQDWEIRLSVCSHQTWLKSLSLSCLIVNRSSRQENMWREWGDWEMWDNFHLHHPCRAPPNVNLRSDQPKWKHLCGSAVPLKKYRRYLMFKLNIVKLSRIQQYSPVTTCRWAVCLVAHQHFDLS